MKFVLLNIWLFSQSNYFNLKEMQELKFKLTDFSNEVLFNILLNAKPKDIANYCQTSHRASEICKDQSFWRAKLWKDYGKQEKIEGMTWKEQYQLGPIKVINSPLSAGAGTHYGIIDSQGQLYLAGNNKYGQIGDQYPRLVNTPVNIPFVSKVISVITGMTSTGVVTEDGKTYSWGMTQDKKTPSLVEPLKNRIAKKIQSGGAGYGVILEDGSIYLEVSVRVSNGRFESVNSFPKLNWKIIDLAIVSRYISEVVSTVVYLATSNGELYSLAYKESTNPQITRIELLESVKQIVGGRKHLLILTVNGNVYSMGSNKYGQLGIDPKAKKYSDVPLKILFSSPVSFISAGYRTSAAITEDGKLYMWGSTNMDNIIDKNMTKSLPKTVKRLHVLDIYTRFNRGKDYPPVRLVALNLTDLAVKFKNYADQNRQIEDYIDDDDRFNQLIKYYTDGILIGKPDDAPELNIAYFMEYLNIDVPVKTSKLYILDIYTEENSDKEDSSVRLVAPNLTDLAAKFKDYADQNREGEDYAEEDDQFNQVIKSYTDGILIGKPNSSSILNMAHTLDYSIVDVPQTVPKLEPLVVKSPFIPGAGRVSYIPNPINIDIGQKVKYVANTGLFTIAMTEDGVVNYWGDARLSPH